jgi:hypothetical protein
LFAEEEQHRKHSIFISTFSNFLSGSIPERTGEMSKMGLINKRYLLTLNQRVCVPKTLSVLIGEGIMLCGKRGRDGKDAAK